MSFICHIHNYTEYNEEWNVFSAFNPSKCTHLEQWAADCAAPGEQSWTSCRSRDSNPQPWVTSGFKSNALSTRPRLRRSLHLTHPKRIHTWSSGQPLYRARGAARGSVPCSRALQSQFLPARDSNLRTSGYRPDSLTIRPRLPLKHMHIFALLWLFSVDLTFSRAAPQLVCSIAACYWSNYFGCFRQY